jgi:hypothetical protein
MNRDTLVLHNGFLCIKSVSTVSTSPEYTMAFYPCFKCSESDAQFQGFPLGAEMGHTGSGVYRTLAFNLDGRNFTLADYGQTKPIHFEIVPAAMPKSGGKKVRWNCGRWEKLLKMGWVYLPYAEEAP